MPLSQRAKNLQRDVLWLETVSMGEYQRKIMGLCNQVLHRENIPKEKYVRRSTANFAVKLIEVDRIRLSSKEKKIVAQCISNDFPRIYSRLETELISPDPYDREDAALSYCDSLRSLMYRLENLPRIIPAWDEKDESPQKTNTETNPQASKLEILGHKESDEQLRAITTLAMNAAKVAKSVEDRFFVEQAQTSYIPESVRLLRGLMSAPLNVKNEAVLSFLHQLTLIERQLQGIIARGEDDHRQAQAAHTAFLESKN